MMFTHSVPQSVPPAAQEQSELRHVSLGPHIVPHAPQFTGSTIVFVHAPSQRIPMAQSQSESRQTSPPGHTVVQLPQ